MSSYIFEWRSANFTKTTSIDRRNDRLKHIWDFSRICGMPTHLIVEYCNVQIAYPVYTQMYDLEHQYDCTLQQLQWTIDQIRSDAAANPGAICYCPDFPNDDEGRELNQITKNMNCMFAPTIRIYYDGTYKVVDLTAENCRAVYRTLYDKNSPHAAVWLRMADAITYKY